ncbi:MAG: hypothetical protein H6937_13090, partial [Burkholderiales bacterium]|nr:hypothetical protein [Burkholderiales bacterium]
NTKDNEHVEVHEISGFMSDSVMGADGIPYTIAQDLPHGAYGIDIKKYYF